MPCWVWQCHIVNCAWDGCLVMAGRADVTVVLNVPVFQRKLLQVLLEGGHLGAHVLQPGVLHGLAQRLVHISGLGRPLQALDAWSPPHCWSLASIAHCSCARGSCMKSSQIHTE